jgi:uncharacterized membrane protein
MEGSYPLLYHGRSCHILELQDIIGQETFKFCDRVFQHKEMTTISKSMEIKAPLSEVFTYFARPEHMADQFPENMGLNIIPLEVKNGFGVGTIFRISGDFDGKKLEWDCETVDYVPHRRIVAKMIDGPFKRWEIVVEFEEVDSSATKISMRVDYDMPLGPLGGLMDKVKLKKTAERGMENGLYRVKALLEGTGSIPVYITLDAYRRVLKEKERLHCSVSDAIVTLLKERDENRVAANVPA